MQQEPFRNHIYSVGSNAGFYVSLEGKLALVGNMHPLIG